LLNPNSLSFNQPIDPSNLPQGFLHPGQFHQGQTRLLTSRKRITAAVAGQGGGKTSAWYWRLYAFMRAFPNESHFVGFPTYMLLDRVIINPVDADRYTLMQFLTAMGEVPVLHVMARWIECRSGQVLFASAENLLNWEGSHVISATIDEFDECPVGAFDRAYERTRLKRGYVTLAGTPRHVRWIKQKLMYKTDDGAWVPNDNVEMIQFPSTANPKYSQEAMDEARGAMAGFEYRRLHLGELADAEGGNLFKREYWQYYQDLPKEMEQVVQFWDTAHKAQESNDYSVCETWGKCGGKLYLMDVYRKKMEWPELVETAAGEEVAKGVYRGGLYQAWNPETVRIEDKSSGQSLIQELRHRMIPAMGVNPGRVDKWSRASSVVGLVKAGLVHLPEYAPWLGDFIEEHAQFSPIEKEYDYDDQVDTTSMALAYFKAGILVGGSSRIIGEKKGSRWTGKGRDGGVKEADREGLQLEGEGKIMGKRQTSKWR